jgi:hypothetical protein
MGLEGIPMGSILKDTARFEKAGTSRSREGTRSDATGLDREMLQIKRSILKKLAARLKMGPLEAFHPDEGVGSG